MTKTRVLHGPSGAGSFTTDFLLPLLQNIGEVQEKHLYTLGKQQENSRKTGLKSKERREKGIENSKEMQEKGKGI